ncbi:hypothetical protein [Roseateles sp.]|uniref:hypothetical protein n=1 Tax=Roseateles sp. TaxID=1971397 RepID=UPI0039EC47B2
MTVMETIDPVEAGRRLGHDLHRLSRIALQPGWPSAVREGFEAAIRQGVRPRRDDRFVRKWLQLRLGALWRGRAVASDVTVQLLRELDVTHCPVTREPLTHATRLGSDASVDRLNNDGAYAAANLAMLSARVNRAKGRRGFDEVWALSRRSEPTASLAPVEWLRLAVLMLGPAHAQQPLEVPALPLCAPLPATSARTALQQVQRLLTLNAGVAASRNRLLRGLLPACGNASAEARLRLLSDAVHAGLKQLGAEAQCWDVWLQPGVMEALASWRGALSERAWAHTSWAAGQLAGGRPVSRRELAPWALATRGYLPPVAGSAVTRAVIR